MTTAKRRKIFLLLIALLASGLATVSARERSLILVIDHSGSMKQPPTISDPQDIRLDAATLIVESASPGDRVAVVVFGDDARLSVPWTEITDYAKRDICGAIWRPPGVNSNGTDIIAALDLAAKQVSEMRGGGAPPEVILLTDGKMEAYNGRDPKTGKPTPRYPDESKALQASLEAFVQAKSPIHCIALGKQANTEFLRTISVLTEGGYFTANSARELLQIYLKILVASRGMMSSQSESFVVWPGAQEVTLVVFRDVGGASIESIRGGDKQYGPSDEKTYWSRNRPKPARFYELVTVRQPREGDWQISLSKPRSGESVQIHVIQSVPFDLDLVSPRGGKELLGEPVRFEACFRPHKALSEKQQDEFQSNLEVRVKLKDPAAQVSELKLNRAGTSFNGEQTFTKEGDHEADFVCVYRDSHGGEWGVSRKRIFRVGPADFELFLTNPSPGSRLSDPFSRLEVSGGARKVDPQCPVATLPQDTELSAEILKPNFEVLHRVDWKIEKENFRATVLDGQTPVLEPGQYSLRLSAKHPQLIIRSVTQPFSVGPWPECHIVGVSGHLNFEGRAANVGENAGLTIQLKDSANRVAVVGDSLADRWKLKAVDFRVLITDRLGNVLTTNQTVREGRAEVQGKPFAFTVRASGTNRADGAAVLTMGLEVNGKIMTTTDVTIPLRPVELIIQPTECITIQPQEITIPHALLPGGSVTSTWVVVSNKGEIDAQVSASVGDFQYNDGDYQISLPRLCSYIASQSGPENEREIKETLKPGSSAKFAVVVHSVPYIEGSEAFPEGEYKGSFVITHLKQNKNDPGCKAEYVLPVLLQKKE